MESTGVYWIPIYEILEQRGFEVRVVNARDAKHVPGRKTDASDAAWLQRLHEFGLLQGSFRPQAAIAAWPVESCRGLLRADWQNDRFAE
jgi:transposase